MHYVESRSSDGWLRSSDKIRKKNYKERSSSSSSLLVSASDDDRRSRKSRSKHRRVRTEKSSKSLLKSALFVSSSTASSSEEESLDRVPRKRRRIKRVNPICSSTSSSEDETTDTKPLTWLKVECTPLQNNPEHKMGTNQLFNYAALSSKRHRLFSKMKNG